MTHEPIPLTGTQVRALRALAERNGEAVIDRYGFLVSAGERLSFQAATYLRLMTTGHVEPAGPTRIRLTDAGRAEVA